jgi:DNA-binding MarR family transcriptional regulator
MSDSWIGRLVALVSTTWERDFPEEDASALPLFIGLFYLSRQLHQFHENVLKTHGRVLSEYQVLAFLRTLDGASPSELNQFLLQTPAGMTYTIDQLEKAKLVRRRPSPNDRRSVRITLTAAGRREAEKLMKAEAAAQREATASLGDAGVERNKRTVMRLIDALQSYNEAART